MSGPVPFVPGDKVEVMLFDHRWYPAIVVRIVWKAEAANELWIRLDYNCTPDFSFDDYSKIRRRT